MKKQDFDQANLIYGIHSIIEALKSGKTIEKILIKNSISNNQLLELRQLAKQQGVPIQYVPVSKLNKLTNKNHQGAIALVSPVPFWDLEEVVTRNFEQGKMPLLVMLDRVTDVRNFGAIVRAAEGAGASGIIVPLKHSAQISGDAMKTSAGALNYLPIIREPKLTDAIVKLKQMGFQTVAATEKAEKYYFSVDFTLPTLIIMGSEDKGISPNILKIVDHSVKIPMLGKIESLNVAVAAGIILYEAVRQRLSQ